MKSEAAGRGLDPNLVGAMGFSAGGHLTLMIATSATGMTYSAQDEIDAKYNPSVAWACPIYPAYALTDGASGANVHNGNLPEDRLVPEFLFDEKTPVMCFVHGDADNISPMCSVKTWEKLRQMGLQSDLHTLAKRGHCFQFKAADETGSATWLDQVWDFLSRRVLVNK